MFSKFIRSFEFLLRFQCFFLQFHLIEFTHTIKKIRFYILFWNLQQIIRNQLKKTPPYTLSSTHTHIHKKKRKLKANQCFVHTNKF